MESPKKVLIVEDEKNIVDILRFNLQRAGYATEEAYDGEDGLAKARSGNRLAQTPKQNSDSLGILER